MGKLFGQSQDLVWPMKRELTQLSRIVRSCGGRAYSSVDVCIVAVMLLWIVALAPRHLQYQTHKYLHACGGSLYQHVDPVRDKPMRRQDVGMTRQCPTHSNFVLTYVLAVGQACAMLAACRLEGRAAVHACCLHAPALVRAVSRYPRYLCCQHRLEANTNQHAQRLRCPGSSQSTTALQTTAVRRAGRAKLPYRATNAVDDRRSVHLRAVRRDSATTLKATMAVGTTMAARQ